MVISGGNFKPDTLKPKEVVSLLLDDDELEKKRELSFFISAPPVFLDLQAKWSTKGKTDALVIVVLLAVRQRQEEKRQQEECSKVKERKRKREKYAEKVKAPLQRSRTLRLSEK